MSGACTNADERFATCKQIGVVIGDIHSLER
jgi:hypothetical protein